MFQTNWKIKFPLSSCIHSLIYSFTCYFSLSTLHFNFTHHIPWLSDLLGRPEVETFTRLQLLIKERWHNLNLSIQLITRIEQEILCISENTGWRHPGSYGRYKRRLTRYAYLWDDFPANTGQPPNAVSMLAHRLRRWPNIETALGQCPVFAGSSSYSAEI